MTRDPYKYFRVEAQDLLSQLDRGALGLGKGGDFGEQVTGLLRVAHTLKGAARVVKQTTIAECAHAVEDLLSPQRGTRRPASRVEVDALLGLLDVLRTHLASLPSATPEPETPGKPVAPAGAPRPEEILAIRADVEDVDVLLENMAEVGVWIGGLRRSSGDLAQSLRLAESLHEGLSRSNENAAGTQAAELKGHLTALDRHLAGNLDRVEREMRQARQSAEHLRLASVGEVFTALERTARDTAQSAGVRARFNAQGESVRLDAGILSVLQRALVQLVRNAVAHGIEPEAERLSAGKPPEGTITVEAVQSGNQLLFRCRDDGRGIDLPAVHEQARRKGLLPPGAPPPDVKETLELLMRGGLSTQEKVTQVSGRGIGLDVVREAVQRIKGRLSVTTEAGRGTVFEIATPPSLHSLTVLVVESGGRTAALPFESIRSTLFLDSDPTRRSGALQVLHAGRALPFRGLAGLLGADTVTRRAPGKRPALVLESAGASVVLGLDRVLGIQQVVLRPLPTPAPSLPLVAGLYLDDDGRPRIVLDPAALVRAALETPVEPPPGPVKVHHPVLVIDDSLTTRMLERSILESAGYEVDLAVSAEEAMDKARLRRYGLFLVDVEMPGMDGFTFVERTRSDPTLREVPCILVTSRDSPGDRRRGLQAGARAYIVKGEFDQAALLKIIRGLES